MTIVVPAQVGDFVPKGTRVDVFHQIYWVFLVLGTIVGVVVIAYMLYNAYKYSDGRTPYADADRPVLGELPRGGGGGKKLFLSFGLSTIIVVTLIIWTYGTLLYVEELPSQEEPDLEIHVEGYQFGWEFTYPNGHTVDSSTGEPLRLPQGAFVKLTVTSRDVFHNFGIADFRVKTDAMPGHTTESWFRTEETGNYTAACYELCGAGHSYMTATVTVEDPQAFQNWYSNTAPNETATTTSAQA